MILMYYNIPIHKYIFYDTNTVMLENVMIFPLAHIHTVERRTEKKNFQSHREKKKINFHKCA